MHDLDFNTPCDAPAREEESRRREAPRAIEEMLRRTTWEWCLGHNLAVAGFGFAAFRAGDHFGFHMGKDDSQCTCQWTPGRGVPYRGATPCEYEPDDEDQ